MKLKYTPQARADLRSAVSYIVKESGNETAARNFAQDILQACSLLKEQPEMGMSLAKKTGRESDLRYLIIGKLLAFYRRDAETVYVIRILDGRTDYLRTIFEE